ncbi:MAG TPA: N-6 DNA methylase, partial [Bacteroidia bacterium]|nr:N-6 DNA methylase [Bacteroidia bacterium]
MNIETPKPLTHELPSQFSERLGIFYSSLVPAKHKKDNGQFFTPLDIARFMSALSTQCYTEHVKILDPGCGTAILSCCLIEHLSKSETVKTIDLTVYETDTSVNTYTRLSLEYIKTWLHEKNIELHFDIINRDFILDNINCFKDVDNLFGSPDKGLFDIVISNPPYFKLQKEDKRAVAAHKIVYGQPNIYSIFMYTAARLLKAGGELIFITPRSFSSGNYFRAFREEIFKLLQPKHIHLFGSRTDTFNRDSVLQETLILKGVKADNISLDDTILLSHSAGVNDIFAPQLKNHVLNDLVDFTSTEKIIHLPESDDDERIIKLFKSWNGTLNKYGIKISTGPVVSFRAVEHLHRIYSNGTKHLVPLYQLHNTAKMKFTWPLEKKEKPQYIVQSDKTKSLLLPNKDYIFLRRFSAKDDKSRLVATPYFSESVNEAFIGVENHLNYIYRPGGELSKIEIIGL